MVKKAKNRSRQRVVQDEYIVLIETVNEATIFL